MSLSDDRNWAADVYRERAEALDPEGNVTYFFLKDYDEVCRYMRTIGYGYKGKAKSIEEQVARQLQETGLGSLRTTVRGSQSAQDIALFIYRDPRSGLLGCGLVVVSFNLEGELAKHFADRWFEETNAFVTASLSAHEGSRQDRARG